MNIKQSLNALKPYKADQIDVPIVLNANETRNYLFQDPISIKENFASYPNALGNPLRDKLATKYNLKRDNFIIGNGSTELLDLTVKTFLNPGETMLTFTPSFSMYPIYATLYDANYVTIETEPDGSQSIDKLIQKAEEINPKIIFLCTPNNPTGTLVKKQDIIRLLNQTDALVVLDEAYMEFAKEKESLLKESPNYPNLLVARTFSKAYGLAYARLGFMSGNKSLIDTLLSVKLPYNVNGMSLQLGMDALDKDTQFNAFIDETINTRDTFYQACLDLGLDAVPSEGNFIFIKSTIDLYAGLLERGILIRSFNNNTYRISIGTKKTMQKTIKALKEVLDNETS
ncbi:MAG: histidinol-phosphate transaminase [Bacillota bacterium]